MSSAPPSAEQIISDMLSVALAQGGGPTDVNPGSVFRTTQEASGIEIEGLWNALLTEADSAIRNSLYEILNVPPPQPTTATTILTFSVAAAPASTITIPQGTLVTVPNSTIQFATTAQATIATTTTSTTVAASCQTSGTTGNVQAGSLTQIVSPLALLQAGVSVTNTAAATNGANAPSELERAALAQQKLRQLARGTAAALEGGALLAVVTDSYGNITERVTKAQAVAGGTAGTATVYIYNGTPYSSTAGASASSALITATQQEINGYTDTSGVVHQGWAVSGQQVTVDGATETQQAVTVSITPASGLTTLALTSPITNSLQDLFNNLDIGNGLLLSQIIQAVLNTAGVADVTVSTPSASVAGVSGTLLMLGTVTVNTI